MSDDTTPPPPPPTPPPTPPPPMPPPPPPPPSYGSATPPPYTGGPEAPVPAGSGPYNAVDAIKYGWAKFSKSPATMLVPALIVIVSVGVTEFVLTLILNSTLLSSSCSVNSTANGGINVDCGHGLFVRLVGAALIAAVAGFIGQLLSAGLIKSGLNYVDGKAVEIGDIFSYALKPNVVTTAAIVAGATFLGTLACYVPAIVVGVLTAFAMYFVVDKDLAPVEAITASFRFVTGHFGDLVLFYLLSVVVIIVGVIACLVGIFAAIPVVLIGASYTFRRLHDEPVSPIG